MKRQTLFPLIVVVLCIFTVSCKKKASESPSGSVQLALAKAGSSTLVVGETIKNIPVDSTISITFNNVIDLSTINSSIFLKKIDNTTVSATLSAFNNAKSIRLIPSQRLNYNTTYKLQITSEIKGSQGESFPGVEFLFTTANGVLKIDHITLNSIDFKVPNIPKNINFKADSINIEIHFSDSLNPSNYQSFFTLTSGGPLKYILSPDDKKLTISNSSNAKGYSKCYFTISSNLKSKAGYAFGGFYNSFYTALDSTPKFPLISDDALLTKIQQQTFRYFYDFAHPVSGLTRERNSSGDIVTIGGSGFGIMALVVGMEHGFITRAEGIARLTKIIGFLETCDRYHGAWAHWLNGATGKTIPFSTNDNGADLVETSYMVEGLMTIRQYLDPAVPAEQNLVSRIDGLTDAVEYDWFTRGQNVLYWHWSPTLGWIMNMQIRGYNEALIAYIVAATSTTHPISSSVYTQGYARNGGIKNGNNYYGYTLPLGEDYGGPLFFTHYSFLGLDPRTLSDQYANYWEQNVNQSLINWSHCKSNPNNYIDYSTLSWGLTASDNPWGYDAQSPTNDLGVISPTAAVSALPFVPQQSMNTIRFFYYQLGDHLWGEYGFYDAYDVTEGWWADSFLAIDQGPIICMIENYRSGLLWDLFMSHPKVNAGLTKLGFSH